VTPDEDNAHLHPAAAALARAGWLALEHRLYLGFCHDVNGRVGSLQALEYLLDAGEPLPSSFGHEVARLEGVARRLTLLTGDPDAPAAPHTLLDLLGRALELHAGLKDLDDRPVEAEVPPGLSPVLVGEARTVRLLLLALDAAYRASGGGALALSVTGDRDGVRVALPAPAGDEGVPGALHSAASIDGGTLTAEGGKWVLRLPSLARARAEGR
jgi:hypothetical protein